MVGGLLVSQALTLFTTPVVYLYLDRLSNWLTGDVRRNKPPKHARRKPSRRSRSRRSRKTIAALSKRPMRSDRAVSSALARR